jgi:hypothetical protein
MDTFAEPYTRAGDDISLDAVRDHVRALEARHKANGVQLSGRIIHVCHYLPVTCTISSTATRDGVLSPPPTPPRVLADVPPSPSDELPPLALPTQPERWKLAPRYGHSAMTSGIRSLSVTHEQIILGWTGDILSPAAPPDGNSSPDGHSLHFHSIIHANRSPQVTSTHLLVNASLLFATVYHLLVFLKRTRMHSRSSSRITLTRTGLKPRRPVKRSVIFRFGWKTTSHTDITMDIVNKVSGILYQAHLFLIYLHHLLLASLSSFFYTSFLLWFISSIIFDFIYLPISSNLFHFLLLLPTSNNTGPGTLLSNFNRC